MTARATIVNACCMLAHRDGPGAARSVAIVIEADLRNDTIARIEAICRRPADQRRRGFEDLYDEVHMTPVVPTYVPAFQRWRQLLGGAR